jgi:hypothetical protein
MEKPATLPGVLKRNIGFSSDTWRAMASPPPHTHTRTHAMSNGDCQLISIPYVYTQWGIGPAGGAVHSGWVLWKVSRNQYRRLPSCPLIYWQTQFTIEWLCPCNSVGMNKTTGAPIQYFCSFSSELWIILAFFSSIWRMQNICNHHHNHHHECFHRLAFSLPKTTFRKRNSETSVNCYQTTRRYNP